jgi:hypothetical protein
VHFPKRELLVCLLLCGLFLSVFSSLTPFLSSYFQSAQAVSTSPFAETLYVNDMNNVSTQWSTDGKCPYLNNASGTHDMYTGLFTSNESIEGNFGFNRTMNTVLVNTYLYVQAYASSLPTNNTVTIYDATGTLLGTLVPTSTSYTWYSFNVTGIYNTISKVDSALVYFELIKVDPAPFHIKRAYLAINSPVTSTQNVFAATFSRTSTQWATVGNSPYIDNASGTHNIHVSSTLFATYQEGNFNFSSLKLPFTVHKVYLYIEAYSNASWGIGGALKIYIANGTLLSTISSLTTSYSWYKFNVTNTYRTSSSVSSASIYFTFTGGSTPATVYIDRAYLSVFGVPSVSFYSFKKAPQDNAGQTVTFYLNCTATPGTTLSYYIVSTDNQLSWHVMANGSANAFASGVRTQNISFQITLNSTGDRFVSVQVFACNNYAGWNSTFLSFFVWDSVTNAYSPINRWGLLEYINETDAVLNTTFPYSRSGSEKYTNILTPQILDGVFLYLQTGNTMYTQGPEWLCKWLSTTQQSHLDRLWEGYNATGGWMWRPDSSTVIGAGSAAEKVSALAVYASLVPKWKSLLQQVVDKYIQIYVHSDRVYNSAYPNGTISDNSFTSDGQSASISAITLASSVLANVTLKNLAYNLIEKWVSMSGLLPIEYADVNGNPIPAELYCKEDQGYAEFMFALESFYYTFPSNTTVTNQLQTYAFNSEYMWNTILGTWDGNFTVSHWSYRTIYTNGTLDETFSWPNVAVHGFGMTDEALYSAYLIFGNTTWRDRARLDFDNLVLKGYIMYNGTIDHSTQHAYQSEDAWAVYGRRFAMELYDLTGNSTYLKTANNLFGNFTQRSQRKYGIQAEIYLLTGQDWSSDPNDRDTVASYVIYRNTTAPSPITTFSKLIQTFGFPSLGVIPIPITVTLVTPDNYFVESQVTFEYKVTAPYVWIPPVNVSLWTNKSGTWQLVNSTTGVVINAMNNIKYTYPTYGKYIWNLKVCDGTYYYSAPLNYTITDFRARLVISPSSTAMYAGQFQQFTSGISGGTPPYSYQWYLNGSKVTAATNPTWTFEPSSAGLYTVYLEITDKFGMLATSNTANVTVNSYTGQLFHDVAVANVTSSKNAVVEGDDIIISITVQNEGNYTETFNVTLYESMQYGNAWPIYTFTVVTLTPRTTRAITIAGLDLAKGFYTVSAYAWPVSSETHTTDNIYTGSTVLVAPIARFRIWTWIPVTSI